MTLEHARPSPPKLLVEELEKRASPVVERGRAISSATLPNGCVRQLLEPADGNGWHDALLMELLAGEE